MPGLFDSIGAIGGGLLSGVGKFAGNNSNALIALGSALLGGKGFGGAGPAFLAGSEVDKQNRQQQLSQRILINALVQKGVSPADAMAAATNPLVAKQLLETTYAAPKPWSAGPYYGTIGPQGNINIQGSVPQWQAVDAGQTGGYVAAPLPGGQNNRGVQSAPLPPIAGTGALPQTGTLPTSMTGPSIIEQQAQRTQGAEIGKARASLPDTIATAQRAIDTIDKIIAHPGREQGTGLSSWIDPRNYIPGTDAWDFAIKNKQAAGQAFLSAFETLKGGGQITEIEGKKATDAIATLSTSQSDESYLKALNDLRDVVSSGLARAQQKSGYSSTEQTKQVKVRKYNPSTGKIE